MRLLDQDMQLAGPNIGIRIRVPLPAEGATNMALPIIMPIHGARFDHFGDYTFTLSSESMQLGSALVSVRQVAERG